MIGDVDQLTMEREEFSDRFVSIHEFFFKDKADVKNQVKALLKEMPDNPAVCYLHLLIQNSKTKKKKYDKLLQSYLQKFPTYPLFLLQDEINNSIQTPLEAKNFSLERIIDKFFPERKKIHHLELYYLFILILLQSVKVENLSTIEAISDLIDEYPFTQAEEEVFSLIIIHTKLSVMNDLLSQSAN